MRSPRPRRKSLVLLGLAVLSMLTASGCDSKAGVAAIINGHRISESDLASYLTPDAKPLGSTPARAAVLNILIFNEVAPDVLKHTSGGAITDDEWTQAQFGALQGGSEDDLVRAVVKQGLQARFEPVYLRYLKTQVVLASRSLTEDEARQAIKDTNEQVSVNPRYGSWDADTAQLTEMSHLVLPNNVTLSTALPGDKAPSPEPSQP